MLSTIRACPEGGLSQQPLKMRRPWWTNNISSNFSNRCRVARHITFSNKWQVGLPQPASSNSSTSSCTYRTIWLHSKVTQRLLLVTMPSIRTFLLASPFLSHHKLPCNQWLSRSLMAQFHSKCHVLWYRYWKLPSLKRSGACTIQEFLVISSENILINS